MAPAQDIVTAATTQGVITSTANETVIAPSSDQYIIAAETANDIIAVGASKGIGQTIPPDCAWIIAITPPRRRRWRTTVNGLNRINVILS